MPLDSDVQNADSHLHVEFYTHERDPYKGHPFVRIIVPGDKTNEIDTPARDHHKTRFHRQWMHYQMQNNNVEVIGTPLKKWNQERPDEFSDLQMEELHILKFQTVEQIATASDSQLQRIGMGSVGLREKARLYLASKTHTAVDSKLSEAQNEIVELKRQMAQLLEQRRPGRPRKENADVEYDAATGDAGNE